MSYPSNLNFIIGKLESVAGVAETLTSADFDVRIMNPQLTYNTEVDDEAARYARGDHAEAESVYGSRSAQIAFDMRIAWADEGATGINVPDTFKFLNACGLQTVNYLDTASGKYVGRALQPLKVGDEKTMTIGFYQVDRAVTPTAIRTLIAGAMGTVTIGCEKVGAPMIAKCTFTGKLIGTSTIANADIPYPTDMSQLHPEKFINNSLYIDYKTVKLNTFTLDPGCEIQPVTDQGDPTGYSHFAIVSRKPRFSCDPLITSKTNDDPIGDIVAGCTGLYNVERGVLKTNRYRLCMPRMQMLPPALAAREGMEGWNKTFKLMNNGYTGMLGDTGLTPECTFELLIGFHETGMTASTTGMYM